ncbi:MAG: hypothetical protein ACXWJN_08755, partial [Methyloceanibacter sp.]
DPLSALGFANEAKASAPVADTAGALDVSLLTRATAKNRPIPGLKVKQQVLRRVATRNLPVSIAA